MPGAVFQFSLARSDDGLHRLGLALIAIFQFSLARSAIENGEEAPTILLLFQFSLARSVSLAGVLEVVPGTFNSLLRDQRCGRARFGMVR